MSRISHPETYVMETGEVYYFTSPAGGGGGGEPYNNYVSHYEWLHGKFQKSNNFRCKNHNFSTILSEAGVLDRLTGDIHPGSLVSVVQSYLATK